MDVKTWMDQVKSARLYVFETWMFNITGKESTTSTERSSEAPSYYTWLGCSKASDEHPQVFAVNSKHSFRSLLKETPEKCGRFAVSSIRTRPQRK